MDFRTVQKLLTAASTPERSQIVRAKQQIVAALAAGPKALGDLEAAHRTAEGASINFGELQLADMSEDDLTRLLGRDYPQAAGLRARLAVESALAELVASGLVLGLAPPAPIGGANPQVIFQVTIGSQMFSRTEGVEIVVDRPMLTASRYRLAAGVEPASAWRFDVDGFLAGLDSLSLDARTRRCATEAFRSYVRGAYLASASLTGAVIEGAWYAAAEHRRSTLPALAPLLDEGRTARMQKALAQHFRSNIKPAYRADDLERDASLYREIRNYGVHPRSSTSADVERHLHEDTCGLLLAGARNHLVDLAAAHDEAP